MLTFGRAVSLDDYQTLAAGAAGVTAAQATFSFDALAQRPTVHVWVAGDAGAAASAQAAIAVAADPNRTVKVEAALPLTVSIALTYVRDPRYQDSAVQQGIHDALLDPDQGLFGSNRIQIGQALFDSHIYAVCLAVPGVVAIHNLAFNVQQFILLRLPIVRFTERFMLDLPALEKRLKLAPHVPTKIVASAPRAPETLQPVKTRFKLPVDPCRLERYSPGDGRFFQLPDDGTHLTLNAGSSS